VTSPRLWAVVLLVMSLVAEARAGSSPPFDVSNTTWSMVGRISYSGASSPDLTRFRIAFHDDGNFTYEIDNDQGEPLTFTGFWVQKKRKVTLTFDEASRSAFEADMALNFSNVGFRVDFDIQKWEITCALKGSDAAPTMDFKYRFKSRYVFNGREGKRRSFRFNFRIRGDGTMP
jgi:hypothetical protein